MVHLKTIKTEKPPKVYAEMLAKLTPGFSGAQIANVVNEAALLAAREQSDLIKSSHFEAAIDRIMSGTRKDNNTIKAETKTILAALEAGKCVVSWLSETQDPVLKASIVPRSHSNVGYTQYQTKERFLQVTASKNHTFFVLELFYWQNYPNLFEYLVRRISQRASWSSSSA